MSEIEEIVRGLNADQRNYVIRLYPNERQMGGWGKDCGCPGLIKQVGFSHPCFGPHYQLTETGVLVREALLRKDHP